ncbi:MAG: deoxyguanosinetriphosphate triphosphohydrolase [Chthoniobacterales bacterium]
MKNFPSPISYLPSSILAQRASDSLGRALPETEHSFRNCFQRDRDRIVHSTAFRRLDGKTQVFLNGQGDYYRTRLTHTIEVASISRTIARALGLNEDLAEAIALAHDLGHSPCGHAGEITLNELMSDHGGFDHNEQSLRVVEFLEESYPQHPGLNLSYEVLEGLRKHHKEFCDPFRNHYLSPSLEAQVADAADSIAYDSHDLDDGLEGGLLTLDELDSLEIWAQARAQASCELGYCIESSMLDKHRKFILRCLINHRVESLIKSSKESITQAGITSAREVRHFPEHLICFSSSQRKRYDTLGDFLLENFYHHPSIDRANKNACDKMRALFESFAKKPEQLGPRFFQRIETDGKHRAICDYIAGMTDRYLELSREC